MNFVLVSSNTTQPSIVVLFLFLFSTALLDVSKALEKKWAKLPKPCACHPSLDLTHFDLLKRGAKGDGNVVAKLLGSHVANTVLHRLKAIHYFNGRKGGVD